MALDYLPSPGWAVIYGETPSATRWSELGDNDDALATGAGIDDLAILTRHIAALGITYPKIDFSSFTSGHFYAYNNNTNHAVANGAFTQVQFNTELYDINNWFDVSTFRFTPQKAGTYFLGSFAGVQSAVDTATLHVAIRKNGLNQGWTRIKQSGSGESGGYAATPLTANGTTDYFDVAIFTSGGATTIAGSVQNCYFFGFRLY